MIEKFPVKTTKYSTKIKNTENSLPPSWDLTWVSKKNPRFLHITMGKIKKRPPHIVNDHSLRGVERPF